MKRLLAVLVLALCFTAKAQDISYFNQGFLRQPSAAADRAYLGIAGALVTNAMFAQWATNWSGSNALWIIVSGASNDVHVALIATNNALQSALTATNNALILYNNTNSWRTIGNTATFSPMTFGTLNNVPIQIKVNNSNYGLLNTNNSVAVGAAATTGAAANALSLGANSSAATDFAVAVGVNTVASGPNGATAVGSGCTASGDTSFAGGNGATAAGAGSIAIGAAATASLGADGSVAIGFLATTLNQGSFVFNDFTGSGESDTAANEFFVYASGGVNLKSAGASINLRSVGGPIELRSDGGGSYTDELTSSNKLFFVANSNAIPAAMHVRTPVHAFGFLTIVGQNPHLTLPAVNTYQTVTNWTLAYTNDFTAPQFSASHYKGYLTNVLAGWYRVSFSVCTTNGSLDQIEADIATNDVPTDIIAAHWTSVTSLNKPAHGSGTGILWLPARTGISLQIKNINSTTMTFSHAQLVVGAP